MVNRLLVSYLSTGGESKGVWPENCNARLTSLAKTGLYEKTPAEIHFIPMSCCLFLWQEQQWAVNSGGSKVQHFCQCRRLSSYLPDQYGL